MLITLIMAAAQFFSDGKRWVLTVTRIFLSHYCAPLSWDIFVSRNNTLMTCFLWLGRVGNSFLWPGHVNMKMPRFRDSQQNTALRWEDHCCLHQLPRGFNVLADQCLGLMLTWKWNLSLHCLCKRPCIEDLTKLANIKKKKKCLCEIAFRVESNLE